jgi:hypothetical protein
MKPDKRRHFCSRTGKMNSTRTQTYTFTECHSTLSKLINASVVGRKSAQIDVLCKVDAAGNFIIAADALKINLALVNIHAFIFCLLFELNDNHTHVKPPPASLQRTKSKVIILSPHGQSLPLCLRRRGANIYTHAAKMGQLSTRWPI